MESGVLLTDVPLDDYDVPWRYVEPRRYNSAQDVPGAGYEGVLERVREKHGYGVR